MNELALAVGGVYAASQVGKLLIQKVTDGIQGHCRPSQIVKLAEANAEASRIALESQIELNDLQRRAVHRWAAEEEKKQQIIESITEKAIPFLADDADPSKMEDDFVAHFFDKCRNISNEQMQSLWSKVLAGEANKPGTFSHKTVNLIADLNAADANLFTLLCCFCWEVGSTVTPLIFGFGGHHEPGFSVEDGAIYNKHSVRFDTLQHLESLGLINCSSPGGYRLSFAKETVDASYYGKKLTLEIDSRFQRRPHGHQLPTGHVLFTRAGSELAPHCGSFPIEGFFELVREKWPGVASMGHCPLKIAAD